jgi:hypothetical protein
VSRNESFLISQIRFGLVGILFPSKSKKTSANDLRKIFFASGREWKSVLEYPIRILAKVIDLEGKSSTSDFLKSKGIDLVKKYPLDNFIKAICVPFLSLSIEESANLFTLLDKHQEGTL